MTTTYVVGFNGRGFMTKDGVVHRGPSIKMGNFCLDPLRALGGLNRGLYQQESVLFFRRPSIRGKVGGYRFFRGEVP